MLTTMPTPVRRKLTLAVGAPTTLALASFLGARVCETERYQGWWFSAGLTATVLAAVLGAYAHTTWRTRHVAYTAEDELSDLRCENRQLKADVAALSMALEALQQRALRRGCMGPTPTEPLRLVRRDEV